MIRNLLLKGPYSASFRISKNRIITIIKPDSWNNYEGSVHIIDNNANIIRIRRFSWILLAIAKLCRVKPFSIVYYYFVKKVLK